MATVAAFIILFGRVFSPDRSLRVPLDFELLGSYRVAMPARRRFYAIEISVLFLLSCSVENPLVLFPVYESPLMKADGCLGLLFDRF